MTTVLVMGGSRSGKSAHAEHLVSDLAAVTYVAPGTIPAGDTEFAARIETHQRRRPATWGLAETADLVGVLEAAAPGSGVLVDDAGTWLTRLADDAGVWGDRTAAEALWDEQTARFLAAVARCPAHVVIVSNETGLGIVPATSGGRSFRDGQGRFNARAAAACDAVHLVVAGRVLDISSAPTIGDRPTLAESPARA